MPSCQWSPFVVIINEGGGGKDTSRYPPLKILFPQINFDPDQNL